MSRKLRTINILPPSIKCNLNTKYLKIFNNLRSKTVDRWSIKDISKWLEILDLSEYIVQFKSNKISGDVLMRLDINYLKKMRFSVSSKNELLINIISKFISIY